MNYRMKSNSLQIAALTLVTSMTSLGHASPPGDAPRDKVTAEALFQDAHRLLEESRYDIACAKLTESQRLDPTVGTLLYLALCYEQSGRTASAWQTYLSAESAARVGGQTERMHTAHERAAALEPKLSRLTIQVPQATVTGDLEVARDGVVLGQAAWDTAFPIDPGEHTVTAKAPGKQSVTLKITVKGAGAREVVTLLPLKNAPSVMSSDVAQHAPTPSTTTQPRPIPTNEPVRERTASSAGTTQRTVGVSLGITGVVGLGVGTFFALRSRSKDDRSSKQCGASIGSPDPNACTTQGLTLNEEATTAAKNAKIGFAVGGAALIGGIIVYLTAPTHTATGRLMVSPLVGQTLRGIAITGEL